MSKIKYNVEAIENPVRIDSNTIEGTCDGCTVRVSRRLSGWSVNLVITIEGTVVHDSDAEEECQEAFEQLMNRACFDQDKIRGATKAKVLPVLKKFVEIV